MRLQNIQPFSVSSFRRCPWSNDQRLSDIGRSQCLQWRTSCSLDSIWLTGLLTAAHLSIRYSLWCQPTNTYFSMEELQESCFQPLLMKMINSYNVDGDTFKCRWNSSGIARWMNECRASTHNRSGGINVTLRLIKLYLRLSRTHLGDVGLCMGINKQNYGITRVFPLVC